MPEADKIIHCAVCDCEVHVQRLSARYCKDCKPKAMVLNQVIGQLNRLIRVDPSGLGYLLAGATAVDDRLMDAFPELEGNQVYDMLSVINIGLSNFGVIEFTGTEFRIKPSVAQQTVRAGGLREFVTALAPAELRPGAVEQIIEAGFAPQGEGEWVVIPEFLSGSYSVSASVRDPGGENHGANPDGVPAATVVANLLDQAGVLRRYQNGNPRYF